MKRIIKFRAWDTELKGFYKPTHRAYEGRLWELLVSFSGNLCAHTMKGLEHESKWPEKYILMQFTGLLDKNGKEIYEGDVVRVRDHIYQVSWIEEAAALRLKGIDWVFGLAFNQALQRSREIIGNIYENPELTTPS